MNPLIPIQELNREYKSPSFIIGDFGRIFVLSGVVLDSYYFFSKSHSSPNGDRFLILG